jgi:acyl carrier protein
MDTRDLDTAERIRSFIDEELMDDAVDGGDPLAADALDSVAIEQLITYLEEVFGVTFRDEEVVAKNFASVPTLAELVDEKRAAARVDYG